LSQEYLARRWSALILLCAAQFVVVLDASIVNVALPSIGRDQSTITSPAMKPWTQIRPGARGTIGPTPARPLHNHSPPAPSTEAPIQISRLERAAVRSRKWVP
jgi:hypothetical protein